MSSNDLPKPAPEHRRSHSQPTKPPPGANGAAKGPPYDHADPQRRPQQNDLPGNSPTPEAAPNDAYRYGKPSEPSGVEATAPQSAVTDPIATQAAAAAPTSASAGRSLPDLLGKVDPITRRRFVQGLLVSGVAGAGIFLTGGPTSQEASPAKKSADNGLVPQPSGVAGEDLAAAPVDQRILVLIELEGGNDGLSTVVPRNVGTYYDLRPRRNFAEEDLMPFDDVVGLNPNLVQLSKQRLTLVEGVGPINGDLSHFEMAKRWEQGDMAGVGNQRAGFLARLIDSLPSSSTMTGLSVSGHTRRFDSAKASVLSIDGPHQLSVLTNDDWIYPTYRNALKKFSGGPMTTQMTDAWNELFSIGDSLSNEFEEFNDKDPMIADGGDLGRQLKTASNLIRSDLGVRVIHVHMGGFDTHEGHDYKHADLMAKIDVSVAGFLNDLELAGLADRVLVATTSEFGRRVKENNGGFDHGAASTMIMSGPIKPGRLGEPSPLDSLDEDGNLKTTIGFDRYLATLAESWLGVEAASVLPNDPKPFELF